MQFWSLVIQATTNHIIDSMATSLYYTSKPSDFENETAEINVEALCVKFFGVHV